jgi:hypothetical protein
MRVTSLAGRLAAVVGALGITVLTGLAGTGIAAASVQGEAAVRAPIPTKVTLGHWPGPAGTRAAARVYG